MSAWDEYDHEMGGVDFTLDMMNPFSMPSVYKLYMNPSSLTVVQAAYWPTITTAGAYLASAVAGGGNPYHWSMYRFLVAEKARTFGRQVRTISPRLGSLVSHPAFWVPGLAAATTWNVHRRQEKLVSSIVDQPGREHEESGWWRTFSSSLSGGFNPGYQLD